MLQLENADQLSVKRKALFRNITENQKFYRKISKLLNIRIRGRGVVDLQR